MCWYSNIIVTEHHYVLEKCIFDNILIILFDLINNMSIYQLVEYRFIKVWVINVLDRDTSRSFKQSKVIQNFAESSHSLWNVCSYLLSNWQNCDLCWLCIIYFLWIYFFLIQSTWFIMELKSHFKRTLVLSQKYF